MLYTYTNSKEEQFIKQVPILASLGCLVLLLIGCVPSLHPFYTEKDLIFAPGLLGTWVEKDNPKNIWQFDKSKDSSYSVTYTEDSTPGEFICHLFKINKTSYLDFYPKDMPKEISDKMNDFYKAHLIPAHILTQINISADTLEITPMDIDNIKKMNDADKLKVKHEKMDDLIVFTASPKELQDFVTKHSKEIFGKPEILTRKK